jgi:hypothetical protein
MAKPVIYDRYVTYGPKVMYGRPVGFAVNRCGQRTVAAMGHGLDRRYRDGAAVYICCIGHEFVNDR